MSQRLIFCVLGLAALFSCKKASVTGEYQASSRVYTNETFKEINLPEPVYLDVTLDTLPGKQKLKTGGYTFEFYPDSIFNESGGVYTGLVTLEFLPLTQNSDFIFADLPTETDRFLLESAGAFHIALLDTDSNRLTTPCMGFEYVYPNMSNKAEALQLFTPTERINGTPVWEVADTSIGVLTVIAPDSAEIDSNYVCENVCKIRTDFRLTTDLDWINCDAFWGSTDPKTDVVFQFTEGDEVVLDDAFVAVIFKDIRSVMQAQRVEDKFVIRNVPKGLNAAVVAVAFEGITIFSDYKDITVGNNNGVTMTLTETTEDAVVSLLKSYD